MTIKVRMSRLEMRTLDALWSIGRGSVREVLEVLASRNSARSLAYTTVQTIVGRLEEKGAVRRVRKIGSANVFEPILRREEVRHAIVRDILDAFGGAARPFVAHLVEEGAQTLEDLRAIERSARGARRRRSPRSVPKVVKRPRRPGGRKEK
jgi:BlaI family penicillinase repressor